ncbi:hypothetical protein ACJMK2_023871, partial [Sinanodonta woodiana]
CSGLAADIALTVNPTQVEAKRQETVVLDCQANARNVSEYISKRVDWKHVANDGAIHRITSGFYMDEVADKTKYDIYHGYSYNSDTNYSFKLKILSVADDDDGKYICETIDEHFKTLSSVEVPFTVINPVEKVRIEFVTMMTGDRKYSDSHNMADSDISTVKEGMFEVTCTAEGSNPSPKMTLKVNSNVHQVDIKVEKSFVGKRPSYKGNITKVFSLRANKIDIQTVECSAGIPRTSIKYAGLKFKVLSEASAAVVVKPLCILLCILLAFFVPRISRAL